MSEALHQGR